MKRKYEKPALIAEAFEMTECVAACPASAGNGPLQITMNTNLCSIKHNGHRPGGNPQSAFNKEWGNDSLVNDYAGGETDMFLFDVGHITCDFVWTQPSNGENTMKVWGDGNSAWTYDERKENEELVKKNPFEYLLDWANKTWDFAEFFFGNDANQDKHAPGYEGQKFFS